MLMLLAMPFSIAAIRIAAILKRIAAMLPLLHHCGNAAIARGIAAKPFGLAATPQYFPDAVHTLCNNPPPFELREFQVECTAEFLYQLALTLP